MAEPWEWEEGDLQNLVAQKVTEGLELDYKRCSALDISTNKAREKSKSDLAKDVSSFANSAGGAIVYGIVERNHAADVLDTGYDPNVITREWIEQIINSHIHPRVTGVRVKTVQLHQHSPGKVAYVVHVPQGATAHQNGVDHRYYRRHGSESVPMEDYEIRDVMQRRLAPSLNLEVDVGGDTTGLFEFQVSEGSTVSPVVNVSVVNGEDADYAEFSQHQLFIPSEIAVHGGTALYMSDSGQRGVTQIEGTRPSDTTVRINGITLRYAVLEFFFAPGDLPLFPGERRGLFSVRFRIPMDLARSTLIFPWRTRAARARPTVGSVVFSQSSGISWYLQPVSILELADEGCVVGFES